MNATSLIRRLHQHRVWVNRGLLDAAGRLNDEQLRQAFPIGQGSLWRSLLHLYAAEHVWLEALLGDEKPLLPGDLPDKLPGNQQGQGGIASFAQLKEDWSRLDERWRQYLSDLTDDKLDAVVSKVSTSSGAGRVHRTKVHDVLLHVCTHAQYTTAQVVNMFRHLGVEPLPEVMLITLARAEAAGVDHSQAE